MDDLSKFINIMREYPCLWKPYHKDYENRKILDQAWLQVAERKLGREIKPFYKINEVLNVQEKWQTTVRDEFWGPLMYQNRKGNRFEQLQFLMCGLPSSAFLNYGLVEVIDRTNLDVAQSNWKLADAVQEEKDNKEQNLLVRELRKLQVEAEKESRPNGKPTPNTGGLEKALLISLVHSNTCLWKQESADYLNASMCETAWKKIAKRMSDSDDYYYVWKYQRMWQAVMQRFVIQLKINKKDICSHFVLIDIIIAKKKHTPEQKLLYMKKTLEDSIKFVRTTNRKLAMNNKRYELRPDVINGYRERIEIKDEKKLEESENAPYIRAMQELLKKR